MVTLRFCAVFLFALFAGLAASVAQEQLPNTQPQLRIEAGMHTANIRRIDVSADGRLLVTGSDDKTIRLWSLPEGKLIRTFRVPIGPENGGKINAVAISPDGRLVAAGGWDAYWQGSDPLSMYIYLFDTVTGALVRRLGPVPGLIFDVAFSPDGNRLAAGLSGSAGVRVWTAPFSDGPVADSAYGDLIFAVDFDPSNARRLVTISDDGWIRLYDGDFAHPVKQERIQRNDLPNAVDISPDGKMLALAYVNLAKVDLLRMADLKPIGEADTAFVERKSLGALSWSPDGRSLYAGGGFSKDGIVPTVRWPDGGKGKPQLFGLAQSTVFDVAALRNGGVVAGSGDPAIVVYDSDNNPVVYRSPVTVDMRNKIGPDFTIAPDGSALRFGLGVGGREPWLFDTANLSFVPAQEEVAGFLSPRIAAEGLEIDWKDTVSPSLNGKPLPLSSGDASYSVAIAPDAQSFVLGTGFGLYRYDRSGTQIWRKRPEGETWGLNLTSDGAVIVAAIGDGTIRWYNAETREELLTLFVYAPDKRWIAWTPSGYYAASAGGEDLIGWHVNGKTWDAPVDFFPASLFRNRFYRPDIVQMVLKTKDEARAIEQANIIAKRKAEEEGIDKNLPPVVEIIADPRGLETGRPDMTLRYRLRSPSGQPLSRLEVRIDGRPADSKGMEVVDETLALDTENSMVVRVPPQNCQVSLIAYIGDQPSATATVSVKWTGVQPEGKPKPKLTALLIGVTGYKIPNMAPLQYADDDAVDLDRLLKAQEGRIFSKVETRVLVNEGATKDNILDGLTWLDQHTEKGDYALLLMSGHGVTDLRQKFYFLPIDANVVPEKLRTTAVTESEIKDVLSSIRGNVVFFVDACRSGASLDGLTRADATSLVNGLSRDDAGIVMFASSSADQDSLESPQWKNGAFTEALLAGLAGQANYVQDGAVDTAELQLFLPRDVRTLTDGRQTAIYRKPDLNEDFALAAVP
jgi:WD40 repeat protein